MDEKSRKHGGILVFLVMVVCTGECGIATAFKLATFTCVCIDSHVLPVYRDLASCHSYNHLE